MRAKLHQERQSYSQQSTYNASERKDFVSKVADKHSKIDRCNQQHYKNIELSKEAKQEHNNLRTTYNLKGKEIEHQALNSIKERVFKKHKTSFLRRKK